MRRILSHALALILALFLAVPALAAEELDPPLWQKYGYSSREACVAEFFDGDEAAYQAEEDRRLERQRWEQTTAAAEIAAFDPDAYWASGECPYAWYYDSKEEFMEEWLLDTEEQFRDALLEEWLNEKWETYLQETLIARTRADLGAAPGQVGVMLDGTYISFPDAAPEVRDGRTMVPCRAVLEAFGGTVSRDGGTAVCTLNGVTYRFTGGSDEVAVTAADGTSSAIAMDAACYEKNGVTYMPVRFFAEAMGCDVLWDSAFQTAVLVRRDAAVSKLDEGFTVLNRMLAAMERDASKNYKTAVRMDAQLTELDSINGDKTYRMDAEVELLQSGAVFNLTAAMDLSALLENGAITEGMTAVEITALRAVLRNVKMQMIYDGGEGMAYLKMPALSLLWEGMLPADGWIAMPVASLTQLEQAGSATVGAMLYESLRSQAQAWGGYASYREGMTTPATLYRDLQQAADLAAGYIGDGCFKDSGGYSVLHYDEEDYNAYLEAEYGEGAGAYFSEFDQLELDLKVARSGAATFRVLVQTGDDGYSYYYGAPATLVDASGTLSAHKLDMTLLVKVKNQMNLSLRYTADTSVTSQAPKTAPPAGETVIDPYGDWYGEEDVPVTPPAPEDAA